MFAVYVKFTSTVLMVSEICSIPMVDSGVGPSSSVERDFEFDLRLRK